MIVAGHATPEVEGAAGFGLDPFGQCNRSAALGAGVFPRQRTESHSGHGVSPVFLISDVTSELAPENAIATAALSERAHRRMIF
jgi:hypothetical protein